jgi:hypothetical protein
MTLTLLSLLFATNLEAAPFDRMDSNGDGMLSRREFRGPPPAFGRLDRNKDGLISENEARGTRLLPGRRHRQQKPAPKISYNTKFIDTHNHLMPFTSRGGLDFFGAFKNSNNLFKGVGGQLNLLMPPPQLTNQRGRYDASELLKISKNYPEMVRVLAGGGSLNSMIHQAYKRGSVSAALKEKFRKKAMSWLSLGAVGFGEMTAEHLSFNSHHPYLSAPANHPLFLILSDVAAKYGVPIDFHMEAIPSNMKLPGLFESPPNPPTLKANIPAFESLLSHNRRTKIVWVHLGWDSTGKRGPEHTRKMLKKHSNLYMSIRLPTKMHLRHTPKSSRIFDSKSTIKPEWKEVFLEFPGRFVMGSDEFFVTPYGARPRHGSTGSTTGSAKFLSQLPVVVAKAIAMDNPIKLYKLK